MKTSHDEDNGIIRQPKSASDQETLLIRAGGFLHILRTMLYNFGDEEVLDAEDAHSLANLVDMIGEMVDKATSPVKN